MFKKATGKGISIPAGIGFGILLSLAVSLAGAGVMAYLLSAEKVAVSGIGWGAIVILASAAFAGGALGTKLVKGNSFPVSLGVGIGYFLVLLGCTALFFGGQYQGIVATFVTVFLGSAAAGMLGVKEKKSGFRRKKIPAYR